MSDFLLWFIMGLEHILDLNGYDHILYILALCILFSLKDWKQLLLLITAFTVGHSVTLALSTMDVITIKQSYIEVLIPITIMLTCIINIVYAKANWFQKENIELSEVSLHINYKVNYFFALLFGFIHGMGFSYLLKSMLGNQESIVFPLFSFNIGLELGQIVIVSALFILSILFASFRFISKSKWVVFISFLIFMMAFYLLVSRLTDL